MEVDLFLEHNRVAESPFLHQYGLLKPVGTIIFLLMVAGCKYDTELISTTVNGEVCDTDRTIEVGVWGNGGDCDTEPAFVMVVEQTNACFGWERSISATETRWNSATNIVCYRDRVCYTQHPDSEDCTSSMGTTDKQWLVDDCSMGASVISGTEDCPEAPPEGCPLSDQQEGSDLATCETDPLD